MHKAGFVNIIGNPNVGKSTLMNALLGEKLSIITPKAQTTRHRILGLANGDDYQIVFSDTPGVLKPGYKMQEYMMRAVKSTMMDADIFIVMSDISQDFDHPELLGQIREAGVPVLLLINKIDLSDQDKVVVKVEEWKQRFPEWLVLPISALENFNIDQVLQKIIELLPLSPPYFPKDELTDRSERFFVAEIIREKILMNYQKEIPYSVEVSVDSFKEEADVIRIRSIIYVSRESQKGIIIGHKGSMLKKVGTEARIDIEKFLEKKAFLELHVKVSKNWRESDTQLKRFGYTDL
ncbi:MAG: GTPase Era [Bacteroides sp.]|jgi:GTP-binding protein Era|nr:GTPase Era [Bacteroides sp.]